MDADSRQPMPAFGFLTTLESPEHGLFGGYLVLSPQGRPLEFRCSTPIAPSRAQQILYGPTLRPYLLAEVIGQALVVGSELAVRIILTDQREMLLLGLLRGECVIYVEPLAADDATAEEENCLAGCRLTLSDVAPLSLSEVRQALEPVAKHVNLCEPFGRIIAALTEAQVASHDAGGAPDAHAAAA